MATYTTNYNLEKPEASDPFGDFRASYNDNLDIIDANLGGGGGGGGHTIVDENGSDMPAESKLQFTGNVSVTDDNVNGRTVVDILGGGGANYGFAIDENNKLFEGTTTNFNQSLTYTATEDAIAMCHFYGGGYTWQMLMINGVGVREFASNWNEPCDYAVPIRKGDVVGARYTGDNLSCFFYLAVYGIKQGTNGIFAPVIYSDVERKIGIWRDNKPLYQRILTLTQDTALVADSWVKTEFNKDTMETLVRVDASIGTSGAVVEALSGGFIDGKLALNSARNVGLNVSDNARLIVQYTKTTDSAGSGNWNTDGVPTVHYSTSEQVIGTWVDGKPLYEKTIVKNNVDMGNNGGNLTSIPHGVSDLKECVKLEMACPKLNYITTSDITSSGGAVIATFRVDTANVFCSGGNNYFGGTADRYWYITIRYTKTTD